MDSFDRPITHVKGSPDFTAALQSDAVMSRISVFEVADIFVKWASDDDLRRLFAALKQRHVALAVSAGLLTESDRCGRGIEGYDGPGAVQRVMRIASLGGALAYISMDEPLWYGHFFAGSKACQASIADIARDVAANAAKIRAVFPNVQIGDVEPVGSVKSNDVIDAYTQWLVAYHEAAGQPLAYFQADEQWVGDWLRPTEVLRGKLASQQVPFGIIYNGDGDELSGERWIEHAEDHYLTYETDGRSPPEQAVFKSWNSQPSHILPDTDPGAFSYLLRQYSKPRTQITAQAGPAGISGKLAADATVSLAHREIALEGNAKDGASAISNISLQGVVPPEATQLILGLRLNTECSCSGAAAIAIGSIRYRETKGGNLEHVFAPEQGGWGHGATSDGNDRLSFRAQVRQGQPLLLNSPVFAVTPGATFDIDAPWRVAVGSDGAGYFTAIFRDASGKGIARTNQPLHAAWEPLAKAMTDAGGEFALHLPQPSSDYSRLRLRFVGDDSLRPATTDIAGAASP